MTAPLTRDAWKELHRAANRELDARLVAAFGALDGWSRAEQGLLAFAPGSAAWSGAQVLEHVALADRYLLLLADKIAVRSAARALRGLPWPAAPPALEVVARAAVAPAPWPHPSHMAPTGAVAPAESARALAADLARARALLAAQPGGEGTLHRIRMSRLEPGADRLDLYQYLELIARHAERHAAQIERNAARWKSNER